MKIDKEAKNRFEYMAATICDKFCRYPLIWNEEAFGPLAESKTCAECPLTLFEQYVEVEGDRLCIDKYAEQEPTDDDKIYCNRDLCVAMEYNKLGCKACPANHDEIQADYDRQKASGMTDEEWEYGKAEQAEDVYDKVLAYLKANVDDFPDYHEAIEAVLKMKGGE